MYSVGALGEQGGNHAVAMLRMQLQQVLEQLGCRRIEDLSKHLVKNSFQQTLLNSIENS